MEGQHEMLLLLLLINFGCLQAATFFPRHAAEVHEHRKTNEDAHHRLQSVAVPFRVPGAMYRGSGEFKKPYWVQQQHPYPKHYKHYKKPTKYVKYPSAATKLQFGLSKPEVGGKNCCAEKNQWPPYSKHFFNNNGPGVVDKLPQYYGHFEYSEPVLKTSSYHPATTNQLYGGYRNVKPVTEHIEDDLKYDFRTKTHSYD